MDSRISALITAGMKAFLPLTQKSRGDANPKEMKIFGAQTGCLLDNFKPYQRPKLSDPAHGTPRLQPERDGRVRCSAWLCATVFWSSIFLIIKQSLFEVSDNQRYTDPRERVNHNIQHRKQASGTEKPNR